MVSDPIFKPGQRCGEFIIHRLLFRGLSETYLAAHEKAKTPVYLQCADIRRAGDAAPPKAQWNAALAKLEGMRNPFAPTLLEAGLHDDAIRFTVSEHTAGARPFPVFRTSSPGPSPLSEILAFGLVVSRGMLVAHAAGLLHGDLSIQSIVVTPPDEGVNASVRILGLGSAELFGAPIDITRTAPLFRSPEQLLGEVIDARSDIYALGMLLYTFIAGRPPFFHPDGSPPPDLLELAMREMPASLDGLAGCPQLVSDLIDVAIQKHPAQRFPDWMHAGKVLNTAFRHVRQDPALRGKDEEYNTKTSRERTQTAEGHYFDAHPAEDGVQSGFRLCGLADAIEQDDDREPPWGGIEPPSAPPESPSPTTQRSGETLPESTLTESTLPTRPVPPVPPEQTSTTPEPLGMPERPKPDPRLRRAVIALVTIVLVSAATGGIGGLALAPSFPDDRAEVLRDPFAHADLLDGELPEAPPSTPDEPAQPDGALAAEHQRPPPRTQLERLSPRPRLASSAGAPALSASITEDDWEPPRSTLVHPAPSVSTK